MLNRVYQATIQEHLTKYRQMIFLSGPRQSGKTTLSKSCVEDRFFCQYLNWDNVENRELILQGMEEIYRQFKLDVLQESQQLPVVIFDEIHKYPHWKTLLKGYFDTFQDRCKFIVTGSAKLNIYRRGGDSMMGRYFLYRVHPLSVAEILGRENFTQVFISPQKIAEEQWQALLNYGGFPDPYLSANKRFYRQWIHTKQEQFFQEDLREISRVQDLARLELLSHLLKHQVGSTVKYAELAKKIRVSEPTVRQWIEILYSLYYCFSVTPWSKNVTRSLLKEPKIYLWDWSVIEDPGAKIENLVASHLHKAVHFWTDNGLGEFNLYYLRDKDKNEVDFLVSKNKKPWLMVEVKSSDNNRLSPHLLHFHKQLSVPHIFQVVHDMPYVDSDCFAADRPMVVPLLTFLSQLV